MSSGTRKRNFLLVQNIFYISLPVQNKYSELIFAFYSKSLWQSCKKLSRHLLLERYKPKIWDPELSRVHLHPQIQIPNAFPDVVPVKSTVEIWQNFMSFNSCFCFSEEFPSISYWNLNLSQRTQNFLYQVLKITGRNLFKMHLFAMPWVLQTYVSFFLMILLKWMAI